MVPAAQSASVSKLLLSTQSMGRKSDGDAEKANCSLQLPSPALHRTLAAQRQMWGTGGALDGVPLRPRRSPGHHGHLGRESLIDSLFPVMLL